jgi:hypothetical protein
VSVGRTANPQPAPDLLQDFVSGGVSEAVVHGLEIVEVDEHDGDLGHAASRAHQCMLDAIGEQCTVRELRHRVVKRLVCELLFECLALADVAAVENDSAHVFVVQQIGVLDLERERRAVAVADRALDCVRVARAMAVE